MMMIIIIKKKKKRVLRHMATNTHENGSAFTTEKFRISHKKEPHFSHPTLFSIFYQARFCCICDSVVYFYLKRGVLATHSSSFKHFTVH